ncbi:MAG: ABC transporter permease [Opitutus sp.]
MSLFRFIYRRLRSGFIRQRLDAEMKEEMRLHLELQADRNLAAGAPLDEARLEAHRLFGNVGVIQQIAREQRGWRALDEVISDLRFAYRMLLKHPGYAAAAIATLGLGIGFVTTLFTMINGVVYGQLPFPQPERIVSISIPAGHYDEYAKRQRSCESLAFVQPTSANIKAGTFVSRYDAAYVSANFLDVLRCRPALGRGFSPEDSRAGAPRTVLISRTVWERELASADNVIGQQIRINGEPHAIVGVMPAGFGFPFHHEVWITRRSTETVTDGIVFGRLNAETSSRQAADEFTAISQHLQLSNTPGGGFTWDADARPAAGPENTSAPIEVIPFAQRGVKDAMRAMLSAILGATFVVLLLACANVANLALARAMDRRKEFAVRAALGASRGRLVRQLLTESMLLALLGAGVGLELASVGTSVVWSYMMEERPLTGGAPFWINFDLDGRVFGFVVAVAVLASVLTGIMPALKASRVDVNDALKDGGGAGLRVSRSSRILVNAQMAFCLCLLTVAGLFASILLAFNQKTLPFDPRSILTARVSLDERRYDEPHTREHFFDELLERLNAAPGVDAAALSSAESLRLSRNPRIEIEGATYARDNDRPECVMDTVSANFLEGFGVGLLKGRTFDAGDSPTSPDVAVVNTAFVERFGSDQTWVGKRVRLAGATPSPWVTIVGVAPDLGSVKAGRSSRGAVIYRPLTQQGERAMTILVRGRGDVRRLAQTLRSEVAAVDGELPVARLQTVQEIIEFERIGMNAFGSLFILCGLGALSLAGVGLYGVIAFSVKRRTKEFGVRMALGADSAAITWMVLKDGLRQIGIGLVAGVLLAIAGSVVVKSLFAGFSDSNYEILIRVAAVILLVAVAGSALLIPARRAANVSPMEALRCE